MNKKARVGLILLVAGIVLALSVQHVDTGKVDHANKPVVKHATWKEKNENRKTAKTYARIGFGWKGREWVCLNTLWTGESRFDNYADNPHSTAYGVAQLLGEKSSDVRIQILRGLHYIDRRYTTPCKAYRYHQRNNWY